MPYDSVCCLDGIISAAVNTEISAFNIISVDTKFLQETMHYRRRTGRDTVIGADIITWLREELFLDDFGRFLLQIKTKEINELLI